MKIRRQFAVLMILLLSMLAPGIACAQPSAEMSAQERACCLQMHNQCGAMEMPADQGCCQRIPPGMQTIALTVTCSPATSSFHLQPALLAGWQLALPASDAPTWLRHTQTYPPESPPRPVLHLRL